MFMKIGLRKAGSFWLSLVTVFGLGLMPLAMPATAQERAAVHSVSGIHSGQTMSGIHSGNPGIDRDENPQQNLPRRQAVLSVQPCGSNPYTMGYDLFSAPTFGSQSCATPCAYGQMQGMANTDMTSWYSYNRAEVAWWSSSPNSNLNPFSSCSGFQGWWTP
jgi:hypothetical protein